MKDIPVRRIRQPDFNIRNLHVMEQMVQPLHRHDYCYMLALEKGNGTHEIDFTAYDITDNSIFFIRPGQVHQLTLEAGSSGYLMAFKTDFYNRQQLYQLDKKILAVLTYIFQEYTDQQPGYKKIIKANLDILFIELSRQHGEQSSNITYTQQRLEQLTTLLEKHIVTHKQASAYAEMLHLSLYQLNAITKTTLGKTCSDLINEHIMLEAKRYLLATSDQVSQIAFHLGYEDVSYFIRFFKKHSGQSPEAFRQQSH